MKRLSFKVNSLNFTAFVEGEKLKALKYIDLNGLDCHPLLKETKKQIEAYFLGKLQSFDLPLKLEGTEFQKRVWKNLLKIPYGKIISYKELAQMTESPKAYRAVGSANGKNPISLIIPCHRVVAADGTLGGYSSGVKIKRKLLKIEGSI